MRLERGVSPSAMTVSRQGAALDGPRLTSGGPGEGRAGVVLVSLIAAVATWCCGNGPVLAAEVDPVALVWNAPAGCPSTDALHDEVEKTLGTSVQELAPVAAVVTVARGVGNWQATLILHSHGQRSEREFDAETCDALASATALIIALAAEGPAAEGAASRRAAASAGSVSAQPAAPPPAQAWYFLRLEGGLDWGTMPRSANPVLSASWGKLWDSSLWRLRLSGGSTFSWPVYGEGVNSVDANGWYWALAADVRGCATAKQARLELGPCLGVEVTGMHAMHIAATGTSNTQLWLSATLSMLAALTVSPAATVFVKLDGVFPTRHPSFSTLSDFDGSTLTEYTLPSHAIRGVAGLELRFF